MPSTAEAGTRDRLLDAAEKLFARRGIGATSLRAITAEASANLASVHYHFGSRDALLVAVFSRRIQPINERRLALLDRALSRNPGSLDAIVHAFVAPALELLNRPDMGGQDFTRLMGRLYSEPMEIKMQILQQFEETARSFMGALSDCLPHLDPSELFWRFHYMVGSMAFPMVATDVVEARGGEFGDSTDVDTGIERLVRFVSGGLSAPAAHPHETHDRKPEDES